MSNNMPLRILLPLTIVTFAVGTDTFVIAGLLPAISQELHVSPTNAGQLVTAFSITFALAAPILGAITGGLRRDTALKLGLIGFIIGNAATALAPTFGLALAARILTALGAS
ncbi:MAG: MFS transporter, partial [Corynebacterium matruchotii]